MKTTKLPLTILSILVILLISCQNNQSESITKENNQNLFVLVKYKTQASKSKEAIIGLKKLIGEVKKEASFVKITIHVDPLDASNILLYEEWSNENYYNGEHMKTKHLQTFMEESRAFLTGPPEISHWKIEHVYNLK